MKNIVNVLSYISKASAFVLGLSVYIGSLPESWAPTAVIIFAAASLAKDTVNRAGDLLDDGVENQSFPPKE